MLNDVFHSIVCLRTLSDLTEKLTFRVRILARSRVRESTLAKTPANESTRVQLDSHKLSDVSHKLNRGESKDSCKLHQGESKWTLVALYEIFPLDLVLKLKTFYSTFTLESKYYTLSIYFTMINLSKIKL